MDQQQETKPKLCVNGCGFFGSSVMNDLCSKCYKTLHPEKKESQPEVIQTTTVEVAAPKPAPVTVQTSKPAAPLVKEEEKPVQKDTSRCFSCKKRVGLTGIKCKCEYVFCGKHRYAEAHECTFNYKQQGREILKDQLPVVAAQKIEKI
eukprot:TRINITY_DN34774_c0_g1_i1.p1 TRINITY_DN34774_c0_g1~~TRINITY_DN34774_c0_g1_i1.p1  ORF type:complete len:148 (+),score=10.50 TRINITY_DN34774_c0_g1_i1:116-559(+)